MELGIDPLRIGMPDAEGQHVAFHATGNEGGNVDPNGWIIVDSGLFHFDLLQADYGQEAAQLYRQSPLIDRLDAIIAHEYEEHQHGRSHLEALRHAPNTELPIGERARKIAEAMRRGWKGR